MKIRLILPLVLLVTLVLFACKKDDNETVAGIYTQELTIDSLSFMVTLTLSDDGVLLWEPDGNVSGHTASQVSYELMAGSILKIYNDTQCNSEAQYTYSHGDGKLILVPFVDDCPNRIVALSGTWLSVQ